MKKQTLFSVMAIALISTGVSYLGVVHNNKSNSEKGLNTHVGTSFQDCPDCPQMVIVPTGTFTMGSPPIEAGRDADEGPLHKVSISYPLAIGATEVTFDQWEACVRDGGCGKYHPDDEHWGRGKRPVINVSWEDSQKYLAWLNRKTGHNYRLLTEAEWEYVARSGTRTPFYTGACVAATQANIDQRFEYADCPTKVSAYLGKTSEVAHYPPNPFGVFDIIGNVTEWVQDEGHDDYFGAPVAGQSWDKKGDAVVRVVRGGNWDSIPKHARVANRYQLPIDFRSNTVGFRVALTFGSQP